MYTATQKTEKLKKQRHGTKSEKHLRTIRTKVITRKKQQEYFEKRYDDMNPDSIKMTQQ